MDSRETSLPIFMTFQLICQIFPFVRDQECNYKIPSCVSRSLWSLFLFKYALSSCKKHNYIGNTSWVVGMQLRLKHILLMDPYFYSDIFIVVELNKSILDLVVSWPNLTTNIHPCFFATHSSLTLSNSPNSKHIDYLTHYNEVFILYSS